MENKTTNTQIYETVSENVEKLGSVIPTQLAEDTHNALHKLHNALGGDVSGFVAKRLHMTAKELKDSLAAEQVDGVALAIYNIEMRGKSVIIGDQTGVGKGRQAAAMIRYGLNAGYLPIFFTDRHTLFSDMYRDCKALDIQSKRPFIVNAGASIVDFDIEKESDYAEDYENIWGEDGEIDLDKLEERMMRRYQKEYETVFKSPSAKELASIFASGDIPKDTYDYVMITYSQLQGAKKDQTRLNFLNSVCKKHRVLFIFDEAHRSSSVSAGKVSIITQSINLLLSENKDTQCLFLSATFAKRPESLITFINRTALGEAATEYTLNNALSSGGAPMQEFVSSCLAAEGQMLRRENSSEGIPDPTYTYLEDDIAQHSELFDKVMYYFREIVQLSDLIKNNVAAAAEREATLLSEFKPYATRQQLFYINKVLLLSLKAKNVAQAAIKEVKAGRCVVIGMSDTLECILQDVTVDAEGHAKGDFSTLLLRLLEKTVFDDKLGMNVFTCAQTDSQDTNLSGLGFDEIEYIYNSIKNSIQNEIFRIPMSPIDVIRQLISQETFTASNGEEKPIRFEECTGRARQLEYFSPEGDDDYINAKMTSRKKRHSNLIFNDFQNNHLDVILINACGAIGASAHAIATSEVSDEEVRQRKMLIVQNDLDVNIDLQKRGRINRTGQRADLPPLYEYIITSVPSEKRLNMMLRAKLRSLSANTTADQDQDKAQADFIDISNKYGNEVATEYLDGHPELGNLLGLKKNVKASQLLARIAMLSVTAQQEIVDDLFSAYTSLEEELRRLNQWDLEREHRDFEAQIEKEGLFSTGKGTTKFGGCSYLGTYLCKQKTYPLQGKQIIATVAENVQKAGDDTNMAKQIKSYYTKQNKRVRQRYSERKDILENSTKLYLQKYLTDEAEAIDYMVIAENDYEKWGADVQKMIIMRPHSELIIKKMLLYGKSIKELKAHEKRDLKELSQQRERLEEALDSFKIGDCFDNVDFIINGEETPEKVMAVLKDIRFGKNERQQFLPGKVEFIFALSSVYTELRINLVHNKKWSSFNRLMSIYHRSKKISFNEKIWNLEIAKNNNRIVKRNIITGNILGAFVHPDVAALKPRFITFTLSADANGKHDICNGLLLPVSEENLKSILQDVSLPLNEALRFVNQKNKVYSISGIGVELTVMPVQSGNHSGYDFVFSIGEKESRNFENDIRFDAIRDYFIGEISKSAIRETGKGRVPLKRYSTGPIAFKSKAFEAIASLLTDLGATAIVPRNQLSVGDVNNYQSQSRIKDKEEWEKLEWKGKKGCITPPTKEHTTIQLAEPETTEEKKGRSVTRYSEPVLLAKQTLMLEGASLEKDTVKQELKNLYLAWGDYRAKIFWVVQLRVVIQQILTKSDANKTVSFKHGNIPYFLTQLANSEHLDKAGEYIKRFENEMLFMAPSKETVEAFINDSPCDSELDAMRTSLQKYLDGETDVIEPF